MVEDLGKSVKNPTFERQLVATTIERNHKVVYDGANT